MIPIYRKFGITSIIFIAVVIIPTLLSGQIYIDTGHPDLEKYKEDNKKIEIYEPADQSPSEDTKKSTIEEKVVAPVKSPTTKTVSPSTVKSAVPSNTIYNSKVVPASPGTSGYQMDENLYPELDNVPPYDEAGKCYARCYIADQYEFSEEMIIDRPTTYKKQVIPAVYETRYDTVVVREAGTRTEVVAAEYEYVTEKIMVSPSTKKWVKGEADANCLSADPADCQVLCLVEVPAKYKTVRRRVLKSPSYSREITIQAITKIVPKKVMVQAERTMEIEVPATYKKMMKKVLAKSGGYQEWREVLCQNQVTASRIGEIQKALTAKGYSPGPVDNVLGPKTRSAILKFQQENGLPEGNLNLETVRALGVDY